MAGGDNQEDQEGERKDKVKKKSKSKDKKERKEKEKDDGEVSKRTKKSKKKKEGNLFGALMDMIGQKKKSLAKMDDGSKTPTDTPAVSPVNKRKEEKEREEERKRKEEVEEDRRKKEEEEGMKRKEEEEKKKKEDEERKKKEDEEKKKKEEEEKKKKELNDTCAIEFVNGLSEMEKGQTINKYYMTELLKIVPIDPKYTEFIANKTKNRSMDVFCLDDTRVKLTMKKPTDKDYIHANHIKIENIKRKYIMTQHPVVGSVADFWNMICGNDVEYIISLTNETGDQYPSYYPIIKDGFETFDDYTVQCRGVKIPKYKYSATEYTLEIVQTGCSNGVNVKMLKYPHWNKYKMPCSPKVLIGMVNHIKKAQGTIVVQCETGVNQSPVFVFVDAMFTMICEGVTPNTDKVFRDIRLQRCAVLTNRLHFLYGVFTVLEILRGRAEIYKQNADMVKQIVDMNKVLVEEFVKSLSTEPPCDALMKESATMDDLLGL